MLRCWFHGWWYFWYLMRNTMLCVSSCLRFFFESFCWKCSCITSDSRMRKGLNDVSLFVKTLATLAN